MGRINTQDLDRYDNQSNNNSSEWFKLQNHGDVARVQFLYDDYSELETFATHRVKVTTKDGNEIERLVDCKRNYDDPIDMCPFCKAGFPVKPSTMISMYDHNTGGVKIWERGKTFRKQIESFFNRYPKLSDMVFEIERNGAKGDKKTSYQLFPMPDVEPLDVSEVERPKFLGGVIMDKSVEDMQFYVDKGYFPETESSESEGESQPSRRGTPQPSRGGAVRRPRAN